MSPLPMARPSLPPQRPTPAAYAKDIPNLLVDESETVSDAENHRLVAKAAADGIRPTFEA